MKHASSLLGICLSSVLVAGAFAADQPAQKSVGLAAYKVSLGPKVITEIANNASGMTYSEKTKTLFIVLNNPTVVVEVDLSGNVKRQITLNGFDDTEDIACIKDDTFAIVEERKRNLVFFQIVPDTKSVTYADCTKYLIEPTDYGNVGLEGVTFDPAKQRYFIIKEKQPRKIYEVVLPEEKTGQAKVTNPWDLEKDNLGMQDISSVRFDSGTGNLMILSDESTCVVECTIDGKEVSRLSFAAGSAGLTIGLKQPEGIAMDEKGTLYICCEPNVFCVFAKSTDTAPKK